MVTNDELLEQLYEIQKHIISDGEYRQLGHRIVYATDGWSTNIACCYCPPDKLDKNGYQVKL